MKPLSPELIDRLRAIRERVLREVWLALAAGYRITPGVPTPSAVANPAESLLNPDQSWALRQAFKEGCAVILKNHRHAGIAADADGVAGSSGLGVGRIAKKQPGDRLPGRFSHRRQFVHHLHILLPLPVLLPRKPSGCAWC